MNNKYLVGKTCQKVYDKIKSKEFVSCFRMRSKDFTRNRKAGLSDNMMMVLNKTGRGIRAAVRAFIKVTQEEGSTYSQQAFSKGRMRIKWEAFKDIFSVTVNDCYSEYDYQTFAGYRLLAVDGSRLNLPYHPDSMDEFGVQKSSGGQIQALASCLYDVLNGVVVDAIIAPCNASERDLAVEHLENLQTIKEPDLVLFDRGYPSANMIDKLEKGGFQYLMRCDDSFTSGMKKYFSGNDCVITYRFKKDKPKKHSELSGSTLTVRRKYLSLIYLTAILLLKSSNACIICAGESKQSTMTSKTSLNLKTSQVLLRWQSSKTFMQLSF